MNKKWILCGVAACLLMMTASCSTSADAVLEEDVASADAKQDETPDAYDEEEHLFDDVPDDGMPQVITLQSAPGGLVVTKGTGTVGSVKKNGTGTVGGTEEDNHWQYEDIYVLMMTEDKAALHKEDITKEWYYTSINTEDNVDLYSGKGYQFDNTFWSRPETDAEGKYTLNYREDPRSGGALRYYPYSNGEIDKDGKIIERKSRFFAYYVDDAAVETVAGSPKIEGLDVAKPTRATVKFHIDGSQDLMCGYASAVYPYNGENKTLTYFSARSARAGVVPALNMEHLLTRFTFKVMTGDNEVYGIEGKSSPVTVTAIKVRSKSEGTMLVAAKDFDEYKNEYCEIPDWSNDEWFSLKEIDKTQTPSIDGGKPKLKDLSEVSMKDVTSPKDIGEALFVQPGQEKYELVLCTSQWLNGDDPNVGGSYEKKEEIKLEISSEDIPKFERGMSYNVTIYVYSYQEVKIQVKANAWEAGGEMVIGKDEWK